jgi:hypothetical protein
MAAEPDNEKEQLRADLAALRRSMDRLTEMFAKQGDQLDQVVSMLRRREAQLKRAEAEVRRLRRELGLDDPDPEPSAAPIPLPKRKDDQSTGDARESKKDEKKERKPRSQAGRRPPQDEGAASVG